MLFEIFLDPYYDQELANVLQNCISLQNQIEPCMVQKVLEKHFDKKWC
jgi:hypothetical protein